jgi:NTE family protein
VPIAPTFGDETELTIAVNLGGAPEVQEIQSDNVNEVDESASLHEKVINFVSNFQRPESKITSHDWGAYEITNQAFDAMQGTIARQKIAAYPPDHVIEIARNACGTLEFDRATEMIELGYRKAQESLSKLGSN